MEDVDFFYTFYFVLLDSQAKTSTLFSIFAKKF